jgi:transcriptional regulator with XRE-family HTH domain
MTKEPTAYNERPSRAGSDLTNNRIAAGLTQTELGQLLGVTASTITHWENGRTGIRPKHQAKLAELFPHRTAPTLITDTTDEPPPQPYLPHNNANTRLALASEIITAMRTIIRHTSLDVSLDAISGNTFADLVVNLRKWDDGDT